MAAYGTSMVNNVDDEKVLRSLIDAFGSSFSLEQIASVYREAQKDATMAGIMLCDMQEFSSTNRSNGTWRNVESIKSTEVPSSNSANTSFQGNGNVRSPNQKWRPVSAGSVSSVIGKGYSNPKPYESASNTIWKPLKVNSEVLPLSRPVVEVALVKDKKQARLQKDMEDFLFSMLGDGFQLDRAVIRDVLGKCGYDMKKSMDKLFDVSPVEMKIGGNCSQPSTKLPYSYSGYERSPLDTTYTEHSERVAYANGGEIRGAKTLPNDVLLALYYNSEPEKELGSPAPPKVAKQSKGFDQVVSESHENCHHNSQTCGSDLQDENGLNDEDGSYQVLRRAVQEYRVTMKEYYSAAIDAFSKGDHSRANKLMEQGKFFYKKARDADEESCKKIFDVRKEEEEQKNMLLDLHEHDVMAAIRLLKCHVINLAGMPTFNHLKVVIERDDKDTSKGTRKRRVLRFLEKYSIKWVEDTNPGAILIPLADIDPSTIANKK
ncbi:hypothetical protein MLD38_037001 [Melastoma candidum]|uniref:Uncharacterized protein n=1 Tax=Melastoma candidum TaxID=119954 RepID=A0ACB9LME7_9MYRT|nr:hypothetical protein MLD38_037001 [Melastoma candidum]